MGHVGGVTALALPWGHRFVGLLQRRVCLGLDVIRVQWSQVLIDGMAIVVVVMVLWIELLQFPLSWWCLKDRDCVLLGG